LHIPKLICIAQIASALIIVFSLGGCGGGSSDQSSGAASDPNVVVIGGEVSTVNKESIQLGSTGRTMLLVHPGDRVHVKALLDTGAVSPTMSFADVLNGANPVRTVMTSILGQPDEWEGDINLPALPSGSPGSGKHGVIAVSVQATASNGHVSSGPIGAFFLTEK